MLNRLATRLKRVASRTAGIAMFGVMLSTPAMAHVIGPSGGGLAQGFTHPFSGLDHILAMVAVGLWASQLGRPAYWMLPLTFTAVMAVGAVLGIAGLPLQWVEIGIAGSVIILGTLVASALKPSLAASVALIGMFALMHGHSHGTELPQSASAVMYATGFLIATVVLHTIGLATGWASRQPPARVVLRTAGATIAAIGVLLLVSV